MEYDGAVIDLDGTVYRGEELVPGAAAVLDRLRRAGLRLVFFSNNPTRSRAEYARHLSDLGIDAAPADVLSAGTVTARALAADHPDDAVFLVGEAGLRRQLEAVDVDLVADATAADVLVVSYDRAFDYGDMLAGYRALSAGAAFYGTDPDRLVPAAEGMVPGSGAVINAVGGIVGRSPDRVFGKPSAAARRAVLDALEVPADRCLVVGDRLDTDVALGDRAGMTTVLVRTGVATDADVHDCGVTPDHVVDSLADVESVLSG
jgi:4-nitrophenyl phosphatase